MDIGAEAEGATQRGCPTGCGLARLHALPGSPGVELDSVLELGDSQSVVESELHEHRFGLLQGACEAICSLGTDNLAALLDVSEVLPQHPQPPRECCETFLSGLAQRSKCCAKRQRPSSSAKNSLALRLVGTRILPPESR